MKQNTPDSVMEHIISLAKRRGFIYQGSEIYGGLAGTWDYGPLGVALKKNIENLWWKRFVTDREDMYGFDASILMNQNVWKASCLESLGSCWWFFRPTCGRFENEKALPC
jgi:glycyl-tRNA synthetase